MAAGPKTESDLYNSAVVQSFRFGLQLVGTPDEDIVGRARRAEELGFDTIQLGDHIGSAWCSPLVTLAAIASATSTIRLGTLVLNADMRNPVQLAWEASTVDHLSGGRLELGLGAGHTPQEYSMTGMTQDHPARRKERLCEVVEIIRQLLDGEEVTHSSEFFDLHESQIFHSRQDHLPILVGGNGDSLLRHAGAHADIIGLQGLGKTLEDGHSHNVRWTEDHLEQQIRTARSAAGHRTSTLELNALVQQITVTDQPQVALADSSLSVDEARRIPYLLVGSVDEIIDQIHDAKERFEITYFTVRDAEAFAPVLHKIRASR